MRSLYDAAGGQAGMRRLTEAWHARVLADPVVAHAFSHGIDPHHIDHLAAYFAEALGGPPEYTDRYGDAAAVVRMHAGNGEHGDMDRRAIASFDDALDDAGLGGDPVLRGALHDFFTWATLGPMAEHPDSVDDVPDGLPMPRWTWQGLEPA